MTRARGRQGKAWPFRTRQGAAKRGRLGSARQCGLCACRGRCGLFARCGNAVTSRMGGSRFGMALRCVAGREGWASRGWAGIGDVGQGRLGYAGLGIAGHRPSWHDPAGPFGLFASRLGTSMQCSVRQGHARQAGLVPAFPGRARQGYACHCCARRGSARQRSAVFVAARCGRAVMEALGSSSRRCAWRSFVRPDAEGLGPALRCFARQCAAWPDGSARLGPARRGKATHGKAGIAGVRTARFCQARSGSAVAVWRSFVRHVPAPLRPAWLGAAGFEALGRRVIAPLGVAWQHRLGPVCLRKAARGGVGHGRRGVASQGSTRQRSTLRGLARQASRSEAPLGVVGFGEVRQSEHGPSGQCPSRPVRAWWGLAVGAGHVRPWSGSTRYRGARQAWIGPASFCGAQCSAATQGVAAPGSARHGRPGVGIPASVRPGVAGIDRWGLARQSAATLGPAGRGKAGQARPAMADPAPAWQRSAGDAWHGSATQGRAWLGISRRPWIVWAGRSRARQNGLGKAGV